MTFYCSNQNPFARVARATRGGCVSAWFDEIINYIHLPFGYYRDNAWFGETFYNINLNQCIFLPKSQVFLPFAVAANSGGVLVYLWQ